MSGRLPAAAGNLLPKIPKLNRPPSYASFLKTVLRAPENKKALAAHGKAAIDDAFERVVRAECLGESQVSELLKESTFRAAITLWERWSADKFPNAAIKASTTRTEGLNLPEVGNDPKDALGATRDGWTRQKYADFANKVLKRNPSVRFDKELMDDAFTAAVNKAKRRKGRTTSAKDEKEIVRCLGKESKEYCDDRDDPDGS